MSEEMGVTLLTEHEYRETLQEKFKFDLKSSSWVLTLQLFGIMAEPYAFCDCRYGRMAPYL